MPAAAQAIPMTPSSSPLKNSTYAVPSPAVIPSANAVSDTLMLFVMICVEATGLTATFLTAALWFPWLDAGTPRHSRFAAGIAGSLARWPRWRPNAMGIALALLAVAFIATGLAKLRTSADLRGLQASPPQLLAGEMAIGKLLGLPSPAQYFLVEGGDAQAVLRNEERLTDALQPLVAAGRLHGRGENPGPLVLRVAIGKRRRRACGR